MPDRFIAEELHALARAVQRTRGFGLFFVVCSPAEVDRAAQRIQQAISNRSVRVLDVSEAEPDARLVSMVQAAIAAHPKTEVLLVLGLDAWMEPYGSASPLCPVLNHLNQQREWFRDRFARQIVFVLLSEGLTQIIRQAPDFFDWRSGVFGLREFP